MQDGGLCRSTDKNRAFGGAGHNKTIDYLFKIVKSMSDYYDVKLQPFVKPYSAGCAKFETNGVDQEADIFTYAPAGDVTEDLVVVANLDCDIVSSPISKQRDILFWSICRETD